MKLLRYYELQPRELENEFRASTLSDKKKKIIRTMLIAVIIVTVFIFIDVEVLNDYSQLTLSIAARFFCIISILFGVRSISKTSEEARVNSASLIMLTIAITHIVIVNLCRDFDYTTIVAWDILSIFTIYTAVPIYLHFQIASAILITVASSVIWLFVKTAHPWNGMEMASTLGAYIFSNIFGVLVSFQINLSSRQQFVLFIKEREARDNAEKAMAEVKILRGILPICSFCKNIRNDDGRYESVDAYITKHSGVDFSHTICPDCMAVNYPEYHLFKQNKQISSGL